MRAKWRPRSPWPVSRTWSPESPTARWRPTGAAGRLAFEAVNRGWVSITRPWHLLTTNSGAGNPLCRHRRQGPTDDRAFVQRLSQFLVELSAAESTSVFPTKRLSRITLEFVVRPSRLHCASGTPAPQVILGQPLHSPLKNLQRPLPSPMAERDYRNSANGVAPYNHVIVFFNGRIKLDYSWPGNS